MQKISVNILAMYLGGVCEFTRETYIDESKTYQQGQLVHVTPAILWLIGSEKLPINSIKLHVRGLHQLEDFECRELAAIAWEAGREKINGLTQVTRNGLLEDYTIEIHVTDNCSIVINAAYDVAVCDKLVIDPKLPAVFTFLAPKRQTDIAAWFLGKHMDYFRLAPKGQAFTRDKWGPNDYQTD